MTDRGMPAAIDTKRFLLVRWGFMSLITGTTYCGFTAMKTMSTFFATYKHMLNVKAAETVDLTVLA